MATDLTTARVVQAGVIPIDTYAVLAEPISIWNRPDAMEFAQIYGRPYRPNHPPMLPDLQTGSRHQQTSSR
jgi:hypothetical protein